MPFSPSGLLFSMPDPKKLADEAVAQSSILTAENARAAVANDLATGATNSEAVTADEIAAQDRRRKAYEYLATTPWGMSYLLAKNNAAMAQDDAEKLAEFKRNYERWAYVPHHSMWETAGAVLWQSARRFGHGLAAIGATSFVAAPEAAIRWVAGGDPADNMLFRLSKEADDSEQAEAQTMADLAYSRWRRNESRVPTMIASVLGQVPEMAVTGFGAASVAKRFAPAVFARLGLLSAEAATAAVPESVTAMRAALKGAAFFQGTYEGGRTLMDRVLENDREGKDLLSARDVAAAVATAAVVIATEGWLGGGEMAPITGFRRASREFVVQPAQEAVQEFTQSLIGDWADKKSFDWSEAGWAALGGAFGGALFAMPSLVMHGVPNERRALIEQTQTVVHTAAQAPAVVHNVESLNTARGIIEQMKLSQYPVNQAREALDAAAPDTHVQHFDDADWAKIAEAKGVSAERLTAEWGATSQAGQTTITSSHLALALVKEKPEVASLVYDAVRSDPAAASLREVSDSLPEIQKLAQGKVELTLSDGTKDDSAEVAFDIEQNIMATAKTAKAKITEAQARNTAKVTAELVRTAAERWNSAEIAAGTSKRMTPMQLWNQSKANFERAKQEGNRGVYDPVAKIIELGKDADATTINHELMHHWLAQTIAWANDPNAPAEFKQDVETIGVEAAKRAAAIAKHYNKTSDKKVTEDGVRGAAQDMLKLDTQTPEGAAIHEFMAASWEEYLARGKAPSEALRRVFRNMQKWFAKVYQSLLSTGLLSDNVSGVFDRWLRASDRAEAGSFKGLTAEMLGMSPEQFAVLYETNRKAIAERQLMLMQKMTKETESIGEAKRKIAVAEHKDALASQPVYKARALIEEQGLDAETVARLQAGGPSVDMSAFVKPKGLDPVAVAEEAGFSDVSAMFSALAQSRPIDVQAAEDANAELLGTADMPLSEKLDELAESSHYRAKMAALELAVTRAGRKMAKVTEKAVKTEAKAATQEQMAAAKAAWRTKAQQVADKAKLEKVAWATESRILLDHMRENMDAQIEAGASYRMQSEPMTPAQIQNATLSATQKMTKLATNGDFAGALNAYWDVEVYTAMARMTTEGVKAEAKVAREDTAEALKKDADTYTAAMAEIASRQVATMTTKELNAGMWERKAEAARRRREMAAAKNDVGKVELETARIVLAESMAAEIDRTISLLDVCRTTIRGSFTAKEQATLAERGLPKVILADGSVHLFATQHEAEVFHQNNGMEASGAVLTTANDLTNVSAGIRGLMSTSMREDGAQALKMLVKTRGEGYGNLSIGMINLIEADNLNPDTWTIDNWLTVTAQVEGLQAAAKTRPAFADRVATDAANILGVLKTKLSNRVPEKQLSDMSLPERAMAIALRSNLNWRTDLQDLGDAGTQAFIQPAMDAENASDAIREKVFKRLSEVYSQFTAEEAKALKAVVTSHGIKTTGEERLQRIITWGTATGRQRVVEDLSKRGVKDAQAFMADAMSNLTTKEVAFIKARWNAAETIWKFMEASARRAGQPHAAKLKAVPFEVTVDGKKMMLEGGYAALSYTGFTPEVDLLKANEGNFARLNTDAFNPRATVVRDRLLELSFEAQDRAMLGHIRTAAYLPFAKQYRMLRNDRALFTELETKFGRDWVDRLHASVVFGFNGMPKTDTFMATIHNSMQTAIYGFNPLTAIKQPFGILSAAAHPEIGWQATFAAIGQIFSQPGGLAQSVRSYELAHRLNGQDVDISAPEQQMGRNGAFRKYMRASTWLMRHAQFIADVITWHAANAKAYTELTAKGVASAEAEFQSRRKADGLLREVQGTASRFEQARINQTRLGQIVTFSGKWMINNANTLYRIYRSMRVDNTRENQVKFVNAVLTGLVANSALMAAINGVLRPRDDELPEPGMLDFATRVGIDVASQPLWWLRTSLPAVVDSAITGRPSFGSVTYLENYLNALKDSGSEIHALFDADKDVSIRKSISDIMTLGSIVIPGLPAVQAKRLVTAWEKDSDSAFEAFMSLIFGKDTVPPLITK